MNRDIPIIFSAPMIRALLDGRKTMTRRLRMQKRKTAPTNEAYDYYFLESSWTRVKAGDQLWVREAYWPSPIVLRHTGRPETIRYAADPDGDEQFKWWRAPYPGAKAPRLRPSIHMPRYASRLMLTVTATKIERLQDISETDARAEGIERVDDPRGTAWKSYETYPDGSPHPHAAAPNKSPVTSFMELWNSLHGADAWTENPQVIAIAFSVEKRNIDAKAAA